MEVTLQVAVVEVAFLSNLLSVINMRLFIGLFISFLSFSNLVAQDSAFRLKTFNINSAKVAISGYDPVSYFAQGKAVKGKVNMAVTYGGIIYYFSSAANQAAFKASPAKYEPQYGGWCAYAMGLNGTKVEVDPGTFKIVNGKLYLFYNKFFTNTLTDWNLNEKTLLPKANLNWSKIK